MSFPSSSSLSLPSSSSSSGSHILSYPHSPLTPINQLFTRKELVGKGAYGGVYKGIHNPTGTVVALKVIDLDTPDDDISEIQKEVALLSELRDAARHNITLYHGCYLQGYELWIAMDFASGGSIRTLMKSGAIEEKYAALIVREVLVALSFLHRQDIIHRDVKAANILLTQTGKILLCDFGVAAHLQTNSKRSTFTGTPLWMAPEVITDGKLYDTKADVWSLGITLYEIIVGNPPHFGMEPLRACAIIPTSQPPTLPEMFEGVATGAMKEFLASCLMVDPTNRPTADELSRTKWIKSASKLPMVLLRELIVRYVSWIQSGGQRTSIVGTLPGMEGGGDLVQREDTFELAGEREEGWDFEVDEEDFGETLGLGKMEGLGDEPSYTKKGTTTLDELAAKGGLRPPKPAPQPSRNHPLLRLFDEESNPYASTSSPSSTSHNPLISLPSSSLNTLKPTISLPSFDDASQEDESSFGISLPSFGTDSTSFGGFGNNSGAGWGGAGWGSAGAMDGANDAFEGSPFDTIGPNNNAAFTGGGGLAIAEDLMTPSTTVRSNPFNDQASWNQQQQQQQQSSARRGAFSDETINTPFGGIENSEEEQGDRFYGEESEDTWGKGQAKSSGIPGFGGAGNGFKFGGGGGGSSSPALDSSVSTPTASSFFSSSSTISTPRTVDLGSDGDTLEIGAKSPFVMNRRRADTAPSSRSPFGESMTSEDTGGYPPLGAGLPRTSPAAGGGTEATGGGYPPLGAGLARGGPTPLTTTMEEAGESEMNRPFGGGAMNRPFQFGGSQQRERAATMLNNPTSSSFSPGLEGNRPFRLGGVVPEEGAGERKRTASDGRRQGLSIMTSVPSNGVPSTMITSPSPSSINLTSQHKRQASSLSTRSFTASSSSPTDRGLRSHRSNQLSTSSSSSSGTTTNFLTASPTSSLSLSASPANSFVSLPPTSPVLDDDVALDQPTPLARPRETSASDLTNTAIGYPFPPVGDLLLPASSNSTTPLSAPPADPALTPVSVSINHSEEQEPELPVYSLPIVQPLDYSLLSSRSAVESELEQVLRGLGEWFEVVRDGFERVLEEDDGTLFDEGYDEGEEAEAEEREKRFIVGLDLRELEAGGGEVEVR
ncbi:uncharacterized protein JCM6883_001402 [Sporobolomyces salmoneus]|uniref:uncharacterized protein n=1 Tax=Sporobolomyces salmoneus TaxID=183962 RepID=UPI00317B7C4A